MESSPLHKNKIKVGTVSAILLVLVVASYLLYVRKKSEINSQVSKDVEFSITSEDSQKYQMPDGWSIYQNTRKGFTLLYPSDMKRREINEGGGAETIIFEDISNARGLQLFIVPYSLDTISDERFKRDAPSGVRNNAEEVFLDGVEGVAFDGKDAFLGDTKEVWFIHGGFLYEASTLKAEEKLLSDILLTLRFTK